MPTNAKTKTKRASERKSAPKRTSSKPKNSSLSPIELLKHDHREIEELFENYEDLESDAEKAEVAEKICNALRIHAQIEEEVFYPAARKATGDEDLLDESLVEHAGVKHLIEQIESMDVGEQLYDAKIRVLGEQVRHHVQEEEQELFPEVENSKMDVSAVGKQLEERKTELMSAATTGSK